MYLETYHSRETRNKDQKGGEINLGTSEGTVGRFRRDYTCERPTKSGGGKVICSGISFSLFLFARLTQVQNTS